MTQLETARRFAEFEYNKLNDRRYLGAAAGELLTESGWEFVRDTVQYGRGWWINQSDPEHNHPAGDSSYLNDGAYKTVALYTTIEFATVRAKAIEFKRYDTALIYQTA